jgi:hypothetical protein
MTLELVKPTISRSTGKTKYTILIVGNVLSIILVFDIALSADSPSYSSTKNAVCTAKVLE